MNARSFLSAVLIVALAGMLAAGPALAQGTGPARTDEALPGNLPEFAPIDFLDPNQYRDASGRPGPQYWQNAADYTIDATLDAEAERLDGTVTISYTNNAPEALDYLWLQLDQNLFEDDSRGSALTSEEDRFSGAFGEGGFDISGVRVSHGGETSEPGYTIDDTRMRLALDEPLEADGGTMEISMDFAFQIPEYGADRMGQFDAAQGTVFEIAQWYPRLYVFDDVHGWNPLPYLGQGEFYLEYGSFDVNITVPHDMIVAATGTLQNPGQVLTAQQQQRLERARSSDETVTIRSQEEVGQPGSRPSGSGPLTWRYRAEEVHDFAWAASASFIWDAARTHGDGPVLAESFYPREGLGEGEQTGWEESTQMVQQSIAHYSDMWAAYPYPVAINVGGVVGGMEYPQIVFCSINARGQGLYGVTTHELGHEWFPMLVGSDERRHAWMDEGLNTFLNHYATIDYYDQQPDQARAALRQTAIAAEKSGTIDRPIATYADRIPYSQLGFLAYRKPAAGLVLLREYILGEDLFDSAFQSYIDRWAYKHPQPADFFRTIEDVAGEDLDWFWRGWFYSNDHLDQALTDVSADDTTRVTIENQEEMVMPTEVRVQFTDGSTATRRVPVEAFFDSDTYTAVFPGTAERVRLDPRNYLPDVDMSDNAWTSSGGIRPPAGASGASSGR